LQTKTLFNKKNNKLVDSSNLNRLNSLNDTLSSKQLKENNKKLNGDKKQTSLDSNNIDLKNLDNDDDDVDTALSKLEKSLDISQIDNSKHEIISSIVTDINSICTTNGNNGMKLSNTNNSNQDGLTLINEKETDLKSKDINVRLCEELYLMKSQKYTFKKYKAYYFVLNNTHYLSYFKSKEDSNGKPIDKINLKNCELIPDVNVASRKFCITLKLPSVDGMNEISLRCPNEESYAKWMSACKLASRNKSINEISYQNEVNSILNLLNMQKKKTITVNSQSPNVKYAQTISTDDLEQMDSSEAHATNLLPLKLTKKYKLKQVKS
jgi:hypothetical protein